MSKDVTITANPDKIDIKENIMLIELDDAQVAHYSKLLQRRVPLADLTPGEEFKLGDRVFIVLDWVTPHFKRVIQKNFEYAEIDFGRTSDWSKSPVRTLLNNEYYKELCGIVGIDNIIRTEADLTTLDGIKTFGRSVDYFRLLTVS